VKKAAAESSVVLASISRVKLMIGAVAVLTLGVVPNLPGFGDGLTRFAFFYTSSLGVAARLLACGALVLLAMILLVGVGLTLLTSAKGVWLDGSDLRWGRIGTRHIHLAEVRAVSFDTVLNRIRLDRRGVGQPEYILTLGLRSKDAPGPLLHKLRQLTEGS
jgi:hypothetical protein